MHVVTRFKFNEQGLVASVAKLSEERFMLEQRVMLFPDNLSSVCAKKPLGDSSKGFFMFPSCRSRSHGAFFRNIAILGALIHFFLKGPCRWALDPED